jgi:hypothetical protein
VGQTQAFSGTFSIDADEASITGTQTYTTPPTWVASWIRQAECGRYFFTFFTYVARIKTPEAVWRDEGYGQIQAFCPTAEPNCSVGSASVSFIGGPNFARTIPTLVCLKRRAQHGVPKCKKRER